LQTIERTTLVAIAEQLAKNYKDTLELDMVQHHKYQAHNTRSKFVCAKNMIRFSSFHIRSPSIGLSQKALNKPTIHLSKLTK
jgi:hypothetical protein